MAPVPAFEQRRLEARRRLAREEVQQRAARAEASGEVSLRPIERQEPPVPAALAAFFEAHGPGRAFRAAGGRYVGWYAEGKRVFLWAPDFAEPRDLLPPAHYGVQLAPDGTRALIRGAKSLHELTVADGAVDLVWTIWNTTNYTQPTVDSATYATARSVVVVAPVVNADDTTDNALHLLVRRGEELEHVKQVRLKTVRAVSASGGRIVAAHAYRAKNVAIYGVRGHEMKVLARLDTDATPLSQDDRLIVSKEGDAYEVTNLEAAYEKAFPPEKAERSKTGKTGKPAKRAPKRAPKGAPAWLRPISRDELPEPWPLAPANAALLERTDVAVPFSAERALVFRQGDAEAEWHLLLAEAGRLQPIAIPAGREGSAARAARRSLVTASPDGRRALLTMPSRTQVYELHLPEGPVEDRVSFQPWLIARGSRFLAGALFASLTSHHLFVMNAADPKPIYVENVSGGSLAAAADGRLLLVSTLDDDASGSQIVVYAVEGPKVRRVGAYSSGLNPRLVERDGRIYVDCLDGCFVVSDLSDLGVP
jgi:hypothetical protein